MLHGSALDVDGQVHMTHHAHDNTISHMRPRFWYLLLPSPALFYLSTSPPSPSTPIKRRSNTCAHYAPPLQRLFVGLTPSKQTTEIGVIDLRKVGHGAYPGVDAVIDLRKGAPR